MDLVYLLLFVALLAATLWMIHAFDRI